MKSKLSKILSLCLAALCFAGCHRETSPDTDVSVSELRQDVCLGQTSDMGQEYLDSFVFLGESTTYHMVSRGVLKDGKNTKQVWAPKNGTINLDSTITALTIVYPETGEEITIAQAAARKRPAYLVLTFGLNGAVQNIKRGETYYKSVYASLLDAVYAASPSTIIILQSAFPVASNMDMNRYSVDVKTLNEYIQTINGWTLDLCAERGIPYLNTAEILYDEAGFLKQSYQNGDGHHLSTEGYIAILQYIRTHGYQKKGGPT